MRGKKTIINSVMGLVEELAAIIVAFILPRLILSVYGSVYNGLTTSITQFLQCAVLLRCGIGGATRAALYKPLAEKNEEEINSIVKATDLFMKKIGVILGVSIITFAAIYPFFVAAEFDWFFTFSLFLIIGVSTFAESFFGITYMILLQADQMLWISSLLRTVCYILNLVVSVILIRLNCSIHIVKLGSAIVYVIYPIVLQLYIRRKYRINLHVQPNNKAISHRWDAFWHQFSLFIMDNTDVIVLTVLTNMLEVSVYSVYSLVVYGIRRLVMAFSNGLEAAFGNMLAKKEDKALLENLSVVETIIYTVSTIVYTVSFVMVLSFVRIYTNGVHDVDYLRPMFAYILLISQFFYCIRLPYQMVVQAAGRYKETKYIAIIEPVLNISLSIALVIRYGLVGVAIGTLAASFFKTVMFARYMSASVAKRPQWIMVKKCVISFVEAICAVIVVQFLRLQAPQSYIVWVFQAVIVTAITTLIVVGVNYVVFNHDIKMMTVKLNNIIRKRT